MLKYILIHKNVKWGLEMNKTIETIMNRSSLRGYKDEMISDEHLDLILESAMRAPTAGNMMMYSILVIKDKEKIKKLAKSCDDQPFIANAPVVLIFLADASKWYKYYEINGTREFLASRGEEFKEPKKSELYLCLEDATIAAQNAVIAAESLGIGSCYIGDIIEKCEYHRELLKLPKYVLPAAMITLGYYPGNNNKILRERFDKKYIVFNEEYKELSAEEISEMYKNWDKRYNKMNKYNAENFAQYHYKMKLNSDFSKEMDRSFKEILNEWSN